MAEALGDLRVTEDLSYKLTAELLGIASQLNDLLTQLNSHSDLVFPLLQSSMPDVSRKMFACALTFATSAHMFKQFNTRNTTTTTTTTTTTRTTTQTKRAEPGRDRLKTNEATKTKQFVLFVLCF